MSVTCYDVYGNAVEVEPSQIHFRPAAYGIFIENEHMLVQSHPITQLWHPPGLVLDEQVEVEQVLQKHFRQLIHVAPAINSLLWIEEQFRIDETQQAWHLSVMYFQAKRPLSSSTTAIKTGQLLTWLPLKSLQRAQMQFGYSAVQAAQRHQLLQR